MKKLLLILAAAGLVLALNSAATAYTYTSAGDGDYNDTVGDGTWTSGDAGSGDSPYSTGADTVNIGHAIQYKPAEEAVADGDTIVINSGGTFLIDQSWIHGEVSDRLDNTLEGATVEMNGGLFRYDHYNNAQTAQGDFVVKDDSTFETYWGWVVRTTTYGSLSFGASGKTLLFQSRDLKNNTVQDPVKFVDSVIDTSGTLKIRGGYTGSNETVADAKVILDGVTVSDMATLSIDADATDTGGDLEKSGTLTIDLTGTVYTGDANDTWTVYDIDTNLDVSGSWTEALVKDGGAATQGTDYLGYADGVVTGVVPEPATLALIGLGGLGVLVRRKRQ